MSTITSVQTEATNVELRIKNTVTVPYTSIGILTSVLALGQQIENENVYRLWDLLKDGAFTFDTAISREQVMQRLFGNAPGRIRARLKTIESKKSGRSVTEIFAGSQTPEELRLRAQYAEFTNQLGGAVRGLGERLRGIGADILVTQDESGVTRYLIPLDRATIDSAISKLKNDGKNIRERVKILDNLRDLV